MQLVVNINGTRLTALLNSGSTHNFVDVEVAARAGIQLGAP
jgi:predicted aspartyl protease